MGFNDITAAGQTFSEAAFGGETVDYAYANGTAALSGIGAVVNQFEVTDTLADFSTRQRKVLRVVSAKANWGDIVPEDRGRITYGGIVAVIESRDGVTSAGEPAYELGCKVLT